MLTAKDIEMTVYVLDTTPGGWEAFHRLGMALSLVEPAKALGLSDDDMEIVRALVLDAIDDLCDRLQSA